MFRFMKPEIPETVDVPVHLELAKTLMNYIISLQQKAWLTCLGGARRPTEMYWFEQKLLQNRELRKT